MKEKMTIRESSSQETWNASNKGDVITFKEYATAHVCPPSRYNDLSRFDANVT